MIAELAKVSATIGLLGYIPYIISIVRKKTVPNPATWWIWGIVGWVAVASYFSAGGTETFWLMFSYALGPSTIGLLSFWYGKVSSLEKFDIYCLIVSFISLILWKITAIPTLALLINLGIDITGALPTLRKTYFEPDTEDTLAWSIFWIGNTMNFANIIIFGDWNLVSIPYPLYLFVLASSMLLLLRRKSTFKKKPVIKN